MKKYFTSKKFRLWNLIHQVSSQESNLRYKDWRKNENRLLGALNAEDRKLYVRKKRYRRNFAKTYFNHRKIEAPATFSFRKNPEEVISFINQIEGFRSANEKVFVMLKKVKEIDHDAIVILLPVMINFYHNGIKFNGDFPKNKAARKILEESGFFEQLDSYLIKRPKTSIAQKEYKIGDQNAICTHGTAQIDQNLTSRVVRNATSTVWGEPRRCPGVQNIFLELMQNTHKHASPEGEGKKYWWLSVNHNHDKKTVSFAFVDYGMGIFKSLNSKHQTNALYKVLDRLLARRPYKNNSDALKLILDGELHATATGEVHRGKGLPALKDALERNDILNLTVISNDAYVDVSADNVLNLQENFSGTFVYCEIDQTVNNFELRKS